MRLKALQLPSTHLFVPEGGRCALAQHGIKQLAHEISQYCQQHKLNRPLIMLPSGTGTTALYLQKNLAYPVLTCAVVGGDDYLKTQFAELEPEHRLWPRILPLRKKHHFGKLYLEQYQLWLRLLQETKIEFDLLYDPLGWQSLLAHLQGNNDDADIIYIHQGGLIGNQSMLPRYQRKFEPDQ